MCVSVCVYVRAAFTALCVCLCVYVCVLMVRVCVCVDGACVFVCVCLCVRARSRAYVTLVFNFPEYHSGFPKVTSVVHERKSVKKYMYPGCIH